MISITSAQYVQATGSDICTNSASCVTTTANSIIVSGITTSAATIQVFTSAWTPVYNQQVSGLSVTIPNIATGTYIVKVSKLGTGGTWPAVCNVQINNVVVSAGTDPCATNVTAPTFSFCPQSMAVATTSAGCFEFSFTPPSVSDNCAATPSVNYLLKRGSAVINRTPTTPAELIIGTWRNTSSYRKSVDANGNVYGTTLIATPPQAFSELRQNGTYTTSTSTGTWELSPDGTKSIYDKGTADERYYTNIQLTTTQFKVLGPYRLNGQLYFPNTLYEYWTEKPQPNIWVNICSPNLTDTIVYTATDTRGNKSTCNFNVTLKTPIAGGDICTSPTSSVTTAANSIIVSGITTSAAIVQVFTSAWTSVYNQQVSGTSVTIPNIAAGTYIVKVSKLGTGGTWPAVCNVQINNVVVSAGTDPCATDVTAPTISFCPQSMAIATTSAGCFEFSFTPPSVSDNCAATPSVNYLLKRGSAVINRTATTPAQLIIGTWRNTSSYRKSVDDLGNILSSTLIATPAQAFSELRQNGTYTTSTSTGTWELSPDGTKSIYDKGTADERYYTNIQLTTTQFKVLGPYRLNGQLYFSNTLYEYWTERPQPNVWVNICAPTLTDTVVYTATDTRGNKSTCSFSVVVTPPTTGGGLNDIQLAIGTSTSFYRQWTPITMRVSAKNNGATPMTNVKIELKRPAKTASGGTKTPSLGTFNDYCAGSIECSEWIIPSLAEGATATLDAPFFVLDATLPIVVTTTLLASTPTDVGTANNTASVSIAPQTAANAPVIAQLAYQKPTQLIPIVVQRIAPNPTAGELIVKLESLDEREVTFEFFNTLGKLVKTEKRAVDKGVNRVEFEVYDLEQGVHFIVPSTTQGNKVPTKFVKM
jgi:hypothetical protein